MSDNRKRKKGTLHEDRYTFFTISCSFLLRMRYVSDKSCRENQNTHFVFSNLFFFSENPTVYEINWKNIVESGASHKWQYEACALHLGYLGLQINTLRLYNTHCFPTATMVALTCLNITLHLPGFVQCSLVSLQIFS